VSRKGELSLKPSDFYVGVLSFFSILVPGAVATAVLEPLLAKSVLGPVISAPPSPAGNWVVFLITAYFVGHLIFLTGAYVDQFYDRLRKRRHPLTNQSAYTCATNIRCELLKEAETKAVNTFQWSLAILTAMFPPAAGHVHELEAESKFFRSLLVVFSLGGIVLLARGQWAAAIVALLLVYPCFERYYERRLKSTTQAYMYIITLFRLGKLCGPPTASPGQAARAADG
jgi:hypothetical protein